MKKISNVLSYIFSPLFIPTYGMILASYLSLLVLLPSSVLWTTITIIFIITCVIPATGILAMYRTGLVSDPALNDRTERTVPYVLVVLCYLGGCLFLYRASAPAWLYMFFAGGAVAGAISAIVNRWWKISAHAAGMGGLVAMMFSMASSQYALHSLDIWISVAIILTGMVMSARVYLDRHTLMQVMAGAANGFVCVWLLSMFSL